MLAPLVQDLSAPLSDISQVIEQTLLVHDKESLRVIDFLLNPEQRQLDLSVTGRDIIVKPRQCGISTWRVAQQVIKCLVYPNFNAVMVSHNVEATAKLLKKAHFFIDNYKGPRTKLKNKNLNTIVFPNGSTLSIGTAGNPNFGVGDTVHDLHCSEIPLWPKPEDLTQGLFNAVPRNGTLTMEATGRRVGSFYHKLTLANLAPGTLYTVHFFDWLDRPEYSITLTAEEAEEVLSNLDSAIEEPEFLEKAPQATAEQVFWRRRKILDELLGDISRFKNEYPLDLDDAFQSHGYGIFPYVNYIKSPRWKEIQNPDFITNFSKKYTLHILEGHPKKRLTYVAGVDVSGGVGKDYSTIEVGCVETNEQVAEFRTNKIRPDDFAHYIKDLCNYFGPCLVVPESNNYGHTTIDTLKAIYPEDLIWQRERMSSRDDTDFDLASGLGYNTNGKSRSYAIGLLRRDLFNKYKIYSLSLFGELSTFVETDSGKLEADKGCHDDLVMGDAMRTVGFQDLYRYVNPKPAQEDTKQLPFGGFQLGNIIDEMENTHSDNNNGNLWL